MRNFQTLSIWQRSHQLTLETYKMTQGLPKEELFGLTSQMRRSASSVPTNIAEGCGRNSNAQLSNFLQISLGSISELHYQFILSKDLLYINEPTFSKLEAEAIEIRRMMFAYRSKL